MKPGADLKFVPIKCPKCSFTGQIRIDRLDRSFVCKECESKFYIDHCGACLPGDQPPPPKEDFGYAMAPAPVARATFLDRMAGAGVGKWRSASRVMKLLTLAVPLLIVLGGVAGWATREKQELPESLTDRSILVAEGLARGDYSMLKTLSLSGTTGDTLRWAEQVRPIDWSGVSAEMPVQVQVEPLYQKAAEGDACMVLKVPPPTNNVAGTNAGPPIERLTFWTRTDGSEWLLDGKRTLEVLQR